MKIKNKIKKHYDIVIVGGGMSGVCAAIAAARHGASTALIHNRPVLGGNASSEIRVNISGADHHGTRPDARETGIIEEILLENKKRNPNHSFSVFDTVLWEKIRFQERLDLYLNTHMSEVVTKDRNIKRIIAEQVTTENTFEFSGKIFIDTTGDGSLAYLAGAEYMHGRQGREVFGELHAANETDHITMGNSIYFKAVDTGEPVFFEKPIWASTYSEKDLERWGHKEIGSGYWWVELGGVDRDTIADGEEIRDELLKVVYGVWDHIKNGGNHNAENYALDWIGFLPGKRESRRIVGDYILKEQDLTTGRIFEDAVSYGGWSLDIHREGGFENKEGPVVHYVMDDVYSIPYRCLYSKDIDNLYIGGRAISASHTAFGSIRVMATCAVNGQAIGTAGALAVKKGIAPKNVLEHIKELQQTLLKDDCYIPGYKNEDEKDFAKIAMLSCSTNINGCECEKVINGVSRNVKDETNCWVSEKIDEAGEWLCLDFDKMICPSEVHIKFDSNLSREIMPTLSERKQKEQVKHLPFELVKAYKVEFYQDNKRVYTDEVKDNYLRHRIHETDKNLKCNRIRIHVNSTYGDQHARIFEVRVYGSLCLT